MASPAAAPPALADALAHLRAGRGAAAEASARRALLAQPGDGRALHLLGLSLKAQGRAAEAIAALEAAVAAIPAYPEALFNLGNTLAQVGRAADAAARYAAVLALRPGHEQARLNLGNALRDQGDLAGAEVAYREARARHPRSAGPPFNLGNVLQEQGRLDEAVDAYRAALALDPATATLANLASAELKRGDGAAALDALDRILAREPRHVRAVAYRTVALELLGRMAEARSLADPERFVFAVEPAPPPSFADRAAFHAALIAEVRAHRTLTETWDPRRRAARGGWLATDLFVEPSPALAAFEAMVRAAIDGLALPDDPAHPFLGARPRAYSLDAWCNILVAEGHQAGHIHNLGWLSGVYYVALPPGLGADGSAGCLEFGRPGYGLPETPAMGLRRVRPREGLAALFPSYLWHGTIPFEGEGERISIAFDVHPKR